MTREDATCYLQSSGFSEEQINAIKQAFEREPAKLGQDGYYFLGGKGVTREDAKYRMQSIGFSEEDTDRIIEHAFEQEPIEKVEIFTDEQRAKSIQHIEELIRYLEEALDGKLDDLHLTRYDLCFIRHCIEAHIAASNAFINILKDIYDKVWEYDIPSPTVPEYIEHHEQIQEIRKYIRKYIDIYEGKEGSVDGTNGAGDAG